MSQAAAANQTTLEVAFRLLEAPDSAGRAALLCAAVVNLLPDAAAVLYRFDAQDDEAIWTAIGLAGDVSVEQRVLSSADTLFAPIDDFESERIIYPGSQVRREQYAHLNVTRSIAGFAYLPLVHQEKQQLIGVLEILSFSAPITAAVLDELAPLEYLAAPALLAGEDDAALAEDFGSAWQLTALTSP
jgi:hypothetical protein